MVEETPPCRRPSSIKKQNKIERVMVVSRGGKCGYGDGRVWRRSKCRGFEGASWAFEIDLMGPPISIQLIISTTQSILLKFLLTI